MENSDPTVVRLTGLLLIAGAVIFWGVIVAAIIYWIRTGSLPFKDPSGTPAREFYDSITAHPKWWLLVNGCFALGIVLTAIGLTAFQSLLTGAGDSVFSKVAWMSFLIGTTLWLVLFTFNLSMVVWAARETASQGAVPVSSEAWLLWMEQIVILYMLLAYLSIAAYGAALLNTSLLANWMGWISVIVGLAGAASILLRGSGFAIPLLIHIIPFMIGILLLLN
ncbi:MAG: hypothetical protein HY343_04565 [Lentisphaerae bacterium]|nr:hypothetical protein [Lentisphaerota bacterium]